MDPEFQKTTIARESKAQTGFVVPSLARPIKIIQGFNGPWSHFAYTISFPDFKIPTDDSYSLDFALPFGTEVVAAKSGEVVVTQKTRGFYEGVDFKTGLRYSPSQVILRHNDGYSLYAHLGEFAPRIQRGTFVRQGEPIALTGKTGWVGPAPHLHFEVFEFDKNKCLRFSHPVRFLDYNGPLEHQLLSQDKP
jgi:murein DD-endopeptidase MepM/ murein hydrolase activator NlpD